MEDGPELGASCVINSIPNLAICPHIMKELLTFFAFSYSIFGGSSRSSARSLAQRNYSYPPKGNFPHMTTVTISNN